MSGAGDLDADGLEDLQLGLAGDIRGGPISGAVAVVYGSQL